MMNERDKGMAMGRAVAAAAIPFVAMAQAGQLDDVTISEHSDLFVPWTPEGKYAVGDLRQYAAAGGAGLGGAGLGGAGAALYRCVQAHTAQADWTPDKTPALWAKVGDPAEPWPPWSQPIGGHDAYGLGDQVTHNGQHWISTTAGNVWEPGVYGWEAQK